MKRRSWFEGLWANTKLFSWPFVPQNDFP